jgi:potassium channel subfamily K
MNDPGLDEPAQQAAQDVEKNPDEQEKEHAESEEQDFLEPRLVHSAGFRSTS